MNEEVKSCPFCGSSNGIYFNKKYIEDCTVRGIFAACSDCGATSSFASTEGKAIKNWNERAQ